METNVKLCRKIDESANAHGIGEGDDDNDDEL
jgi:hypothetical protein